MLNFEEVITEKLSRDLASVGRMSPETKADTLAFEADLRRYYGVSFEEFADIRNDLLERHGGRTTKGDLHNVLVTRIIIDLVGRGYLRLHSTLKVHDVNYILTEKGVDVVIRALGRGIDGLPKDPHQALIFLRNNQMLDREDEQLKTA